MTVATTTPSRSTWYAAASVDTEQAQNTSRRVDEKAFTLTLLLDGAAGAIVSLLALVVSVTVRIVDLLFAASIAMMPNL